MFICPSRRRGHFLAIGMPTQTIAHTWKMSCQQTQFFICDHTINPHDQTAVFAFAAKQLLTTGPMDLFNGFEVRFQPGFPAPSLRLLCLGALGPGPLGAGPLGAGALLGIARETKTHRIARDCSGLLGIARDCSGLLGIAWAGWAGWAPQNELSVSLLLQLNCNSHKNKNMSHSIMIKAH